MPTVPAAGQFGPDQFTVQSLKGQTVDAKFLRDTTGQNYIIDPLSQQFGGFFVEAFDGAGSGFATWACAYNNDMRGHGSLGMGGECSKGMGVKKVYDELASG